MYDTTFQLKTKKIIAQTSRFFEKFSGEEFFKKKSPHV